MLTQSLNACESDMSKKINATELVVRRCRAAMPNKMPYWTKNYVSIFVRAAHWMAYFHL